MNREATVVRSLTNNLDALKSATLELDEQLLEWIDRLVDEIFERTNEIVEHVVENDMLKEKEE